MRGQSYNQKGNILITAILMLVVMASISAQIMSLVIRQINTSNNKFIDTELFYVTQGCFQDVQNWFRQQNRSQYEIPNFNRTNMSQLIIPSNSQKTINNLNKYSYSCTSTYLSSQQNHDDVTGQEIGNRDDQYNNTAPTSPKDYYQVTAIGTGPKSATKEINSIISVKY